MREIKFRAWDTEEKRMIEWPELLGSDIQMIFEYQEAENIELMQCTGLKDVNGVEIYEGDVVKHLRAGNEVVSYGLQEVDAFEGVGFSLWTFMEENEANGIRLQKTYEVIGNIYENPELLEEKKG